METLQLGQEDLPRKTLMDRKKGKEKAKVMPHVVKLEEPHWVRNRDTLNDQQPI